MAPSEQTTMTPTESVRGSPRLRGPPSHENDIAEFCQTPVEIYSIFENRHVATLLTIPKTHLPIPTNRPLLRAPPPSGSLTLRADAGNLVVTLGNTGETWIFRQGDATSPSMHHRDTNQTQN